MYIYSRYFQYQNSITISYTSFSQASEKTIPYLSWTRTLLFYVALQSSRHRQTSAPFARSGCVRNDLSGRRVGLVLFAFLALCADTGRQVENPARHEKRTRDTRVERLRNALERIGRSPREAGPIDSRSWAPLVASGAILCPCPSLRCTDRSRCLAIGHNLDCRASFVSAVLSPSGSIVCARRSLARARAFKTYTRFQNIQGDE